MNKSGDWKNDADTNSTSRVHFSVPFWKDDNYLFNHRDVKNRIKKELVNECTTKEKLIGVLPENDLNNITKNLDDKKSLKVLFADKNSKSTSDIESKIANNELKGIFSYVGNCVIVQAD